MIKLTIKTKLSLALFFLFAVILLLGGVGIFYTHAIAEKSKEILKDNYESIQYAKVMMQAIDVIDKDSINSFKTIETNLKLQQLNITEIGEKEYTEEVAVQ